MSPSPQSSRMPPKSGHRPRQRTNAIRYAVVGLGHIAQTAVLPGLAHAKGCEITALVSDDPTKLKTLARRYDVRRVMDYDGYDALLESGAIDAVYIALPNDLHYDYAMRALDRRIPVLLEKPMAVTTKQCQALVQAARKRKTPLMIAYRLHFDRANLRAVALAKAGKIGDLRFFHSIFSMQVAKGDTRTRGEEVGGGPLYDLGVYCINAARYLFRAEPIEVTAFAASAPDPRFTKSDEMVSAVLRFPGNRLASFTASFGAADSAAFDLVGTTGSLRLEPAYEYSEEIVQRLVVHGKRSERTEPVGDQFAAEVDYFARCIREGRLPEPDGNEGLADVRIVEALLESVRTRCPVTIPASGVRRRRPQPRQAIRYRKGAKVQPIHAAQPHQDP